MLLLHAHLPYVRHPEHEYFLEENWLFEAVLETYIPLLEMFHRLLDDGVGFRLTLSLSPTLLEMLGDRLLMDRLQRHLQGLLELTEKEMRRTRRFAPLARMYNERIRAAMALYGGRYGRDLPAAFRALSGTGNIEFITTSATHAYLPNLAPYPEAVRAQIEVGMESHRRRFGKAPRGLWLPECGYYGGLDRVLSGAGIGFFFLEGHGLLHGRPRPRYGVFAPVRCPSGAVAFGREAEAARRVWSSEGGYPGDPDYREFHRDVGLDLPIDYIRPYIHPEGIRVPTGIKYYRVTGKTGRKKPYVRERALEKARVHALDFARRFRGQAARLGRKYGFSPLVLAPYDAELFGHWWYEGVEWLECLIRALKPGETVTPSEYLGEGPVLQEVEPSPSSWGAGGYGTTWLNRSSQWAAMDILRACEAMAGLAMRLPRPPSPLIKRALDQALRELLLAQSSDWPFLMHAGPSADYARGRLAGHLEAFNRLHGMITASRVDEAWLAGLEEGHGLFPWLDYRVYGGKAAGFFPGRPRAL
jgi:1,4-alpha-glucan branching enzyme